MGFSILIKSKLTHSYDSNNYLIETIDYTWDEGSSQFLPIQRSEITNNNDGQPEVMIAYECEIPYEFELMQNFPNPFNPVTKIGYSVNKTNHVKLIIYDVIGNYVTTLVSENQNPGNYYVNFNAADCSSGIYFYTLKLGLNSITKKCLLLK